MIDKPSILVITGPTASGKTAVLEKLSGHFPLEVVSADSRQIYRYMKIGTAAPPVELIEKIPHHIVGIKNPDESFSVGEFRKMAISSIKDILHRKKIPVISGGTFFYIRSLWDGILEEPEISTPLQNEVDALTAEEVHRRLLDADPQSALRLSMNDIYRRRRALLVSLAGEKPFSDYEPSGGIFGDYDFHSWYLDVPREILYRNINHRTETMIQDGLVDELLELLSRGYSPSHPGLKTIGYREFFESLAIMEPSANWNSTPEEWDFLIRKKWNDMSYRNLVLETISQKTRNYAKRQLTWFRNEPRLKRIDHDSLVFHLSQAIQLGGFYE